MNRTRAVVTVVGYFAFSHFAWGSGYAVIENSASGMGSAFAGAAAVAEDPTTIWFNPAGMTLLQGQQVTLALHAIRPSASYTDRGSSINPAFTGGSVLPGSLTGSNDTTDGTVFIPNFYYVLPLNDRTRFGLGINAPFGLETDYADDWVGRYHATYSHMRTANINPALAWRATDKLSLGVGLDIQYIEVDLKNRVDSGRICLGIAGTNIALQNLCTSLGLLPNTLANDSEGYASGDNWSLGYNLGLLYQFNETDRIGLAYRSEVSQTVEGRGEFTVDPELRYFLDYVGLNSLMTDTGVTAEADLPASASLSGVFALTDKLTLLADLTWTGWSSFQELRIVHDNPVQPDAVTEESWEDTMRYSLGLNYRESGRIWRVGIAYDETPIPDPQHRTPRIPTDDRTWLALGLGLPVSESFWLDLGYAHLFIGDVAIDHTDTNGYTLLGEYEEEADIFSVQATLKF